MAQREFANQTALVAYAEQNDLAYEYEYTPAFAKWQRLLSPEQYEIVEVRNRCGDHRHLTVDQVVSKRRQSIGLVLRKTIFDRHVATFDVADQQQLAVA